MCYRGLLKTTLTLINLVQFGNSVSFGYFCAVNVI